LPDLVCAREFDWQLAVLARWFTVLSLRDAAARLRNGTLPVRSACVTFDDGYATCYGRPAHTAPARSARDILPGHELIDGGRMWNDSVIETYAGAGDTLDARA